MYVHAHCRCENCRIAEKTYQRAYRAANRERLNAYDRQSSRDSRLRDDREKRLLRHRAYDQHSRGKTLACDVCGTDEGVQLHHPDYSQPDLVERLCPRCHGVAHRKPNTARMCGLI